MTIEKQLQELAQQTCPKQVDVVDAVMAEVRQRPYLQPASQAPYAWLRRPATWALTAAAAVAAIVIINISSPTCDEQQLSTMIARVSDYNYYSSVEAAAENPIEFLYDTNE